MQKITWKEYLFNSWHTTINNRTFYIHKAYDDNDEFFMIDEFTDRDNYGSIGFFKSFKEAEYYLLEYITS